MKRLLKILFSLIIIFVVTGGVAGLYVFYQFGKDLPDTQVLENYEPPITTRISAGDGQIIAEYAKEKRIFVPYDEIPPLVVRAYIAAEDKRFFNHKGVDVQGLIRAILTNVKVLATGQNRRLIGASTITQQVAKNFFLTNEKTLTRKIKEAILSLRLEKTFTKQKIMELYLNEIYLGIRSYGVAAAAQNYFNKSLDELSIAEIAFLAGLPKAPNNYHPIRKKEAAINRRNYVLTRMAEDGYITQAQMEQGKAEPIVMRNRREEEFVSEADFFAEDVRRELEKEFGEDELYTGGLIVRSTLEPKLQALGSKVLRDGLLAYDRRHGYRGALAEIEAAAGWLADLLAVPTPKGTPDNWNKAVVLRIRKNTADIGVEDGSFGVIPFAEVKWARKTLEDQRYSAQPKKIEEVLKVGDVILVEDVTEAPDAEAKNKDTDQPRTYGLRQLPDVEGAIVAMDPHTGRVLAMVGGFSAERSQFNRASQAKRQPGSSFKPFIYLAALDNGFTPASLIMDAPIAIDQGPGLPKWKPSNYSNKFYGLSTLRLGVEKSRNLMTVRLAQELGMDVVADYARRFNINPDMPQFLSSSLGAIETTLLKMTTAYAMLVNGGKRIEPTLIDRIQNRHGKTIFRRDTRPCDACTAQEWRGQDAPEIKDDRELLTDPRSAYQMVSILEGVITHGTGRRIASIKKPLGGKTGTTNDSFDAWFVGFSPNLAVGVYVGFDTPRTLGQHEAGSTAAAPIFKAFMKEALANQPATPFRVPQGLRMVRINRQTGYLAKPGDSNVLWEAFKPGTEPTETTPSNDGYGVSDQIIIQGSQPQAGGLY
jgi:penicillin-binding protein 1A